MHGLQEERGPGAGGGCFSLTDWELGYALLGWVLLRSDTF